ncbi:BgTH12-07337 [Blumeria graminis f. sp. triticale]|uniref:BgtA-20837 n=3 Tax=Blumeria graminis TaxID=34373 RepID=A0A9X9MQS6_BLUGR|nr:hypothetical protein BGT96224_A20837 [Blumeria graminis f. sp. tritici 96224]CAD6506411.1 BgTH12-07337 [Blumeria graminis f. sp. triticale]VDB95247.1 BgtA-20837 [Blumeria graminis f. sp. tritici]
MKLETTRKTCSNEPFYYSPPCNLSDFICSGSDQDETPEQTEQKHHRYEIEARRCEGGKLPILKSTILKGPLSNDWVNPWQQGTNRTEEDWWQPDSDNFFLTRRKLMKRAASYGLGYLTPGDALAWCKASAEEAVHVESTHGDITMTEEAKSCVKGDKSSEKTSKQLPFHRKRKLEYSLELQCDTSPNPDFHDLSPDYNYRVLKRARRSRRLDPQTQCTKWDGNVISSPSLMLHLNKKRRPKTVASSQKVQSFYFKSKLSDKSSQSLQPIKKQVLQEEIDISDVSLAEKSNIASKNFKRRSKKKLHSVTSLKKKKDGLKSNNPQEESCLLGPCRSPVANLDQKNKLQCDPETPAASIPKLKNPKIYDNLNENESQTCSRQNTLPVITSQIKKSTLPLCLKQQNFVEQHSFVTDYAPSSRDLDKFMFKKKVRVKRKKNGRKRSLSSQYTPSLNERETSQPRKKTKTSHISYHNSKVSDSENKTNNFFLQNPPPNYGSTTASIDSGPEIDSTSRVQSFNRLKLNSPICNDANRSHQETPKLIDTSLTCSTKTKLKKSNGMNSFPIDLYSPGISLTQRRKKIKSGSLENDSVPNPVSLPLDLTQPWTSKGKPPKSPLKGLGLPRSCSTPNLTEISVLAKDETAVCTNTDPATRSLIPSQKQDCSPEYNSQPKNPLKNIQAIKLPIDPNDRSNKKSSSKNNSFTSKKDSCSTLSISEDTLGLSPPQQRLTSVLLEGSDKFDNRKVDIENTLRPKRSDIDDETYKVPRIPCLDTTHQNPSTPISLKAEKDTSKLSGKKKFRSQSQAEKNLLSTPRSHEANSKILERKILAQVENDLLKEPSLSRKGHLQIHPQSPWSTEVQPVIIDDCETSTKLYPLDNDLVKKNTSDLPGNTQDNENEETTIEQDCVRVEGNSTQKNTETSSCPDYIRTQTPRSSFQADVHKLYQSALRNPWKGLDKFSDSTKIHKQVSFGLLDSAIELKYPKQMIKSRRSSSISSQCLQEDQQEIDHHMLKEIKSPEKVVAPLLSPSPRSKYGKCSIDESPGVGAMAEAFLAAEGKIETEKSPLAHSEAPSLSSSNKQKTDGLFSSHSDDNLLKPVEFGVLEDDLTLDIGAIAEFDADAILGNLGDILEDWTVESELTNINKFATFNQQSTEAWSKSFTSNRMTPT